MEDSGRQIHGPRPILQGRYITLGLGGLVLVLLGTTVPLRGLPDNPRHLVFDPALQSKLQLLAGGLHTEVVLCLDGSVQRDTAYVAEFSMPEPRLSTFQRSRFMPCSRNTLAVWHNHPLVTFEPTSDTEPAKRPRRLRVSRPLDLCALSGKDITTAARLDHPFTVVAVDAETWCWWTRDQVRQMVRDRAPRGPVVAGQGVW